MRGDKCSENALHWGSLCHVPCAEFVCGRQCITNPHSRRVTIFENTHTHNCCENANASGQLFDTLMHCSPNRHSPSPSSSPSAQLALCRALYLMLSMRGIPIPEVDLTEGSPYPVGHWVRCDSSSTFQNCCTTPHPTAPHRTARHRTAQHHTTPRHSPVLHFRVCKTSPPFPLGNSALGTPHHNTPHHTGAARDTTAHCPQQWDSEQIVAPTIVHCPQQGGGVQGTSLPMVHSHVAVHRR